MSLSMDFSDSRVVVIGGTSGINLGVAQAFARHGARVAVASRSPDKVQAAVASLETAGAGPGRRRARRRRHAGRVLADCRGLRPD